MGVHELINIALENLQKNTGITGTWEGGGPIGIDGVLDIIIENHSIRLNIKINSELRNCKFN